MKILHLGLGNFHKAHQAWYLQTLHDHFKDSWSVTAFSMQKPDAAIELRSQKFHYQIDLIDGEMTTQVSIDRIQETGFVGQDLDLLTRLAQDPTLHLVTLTITEKGYQLNSPALMALAWLLEKRQTLNAPLSILSCDNLQRNGEVLEKLIRQQMGTAYPDFPLSFPCSVVDRIVPASPAGAPVRTEYFSQWVIEDRFVTPRPSFEKVGVEIVKDTRPWELMKLRLLNASHSFLAYAGLRAGLDYVHEAIQHAEIRNRLSRFWKEICPHLPQDLQPESYTQKLLLRFNNPSLPHRLSQIATDGSVKLPQRILPTLALAQEKQTPHQELTAAVEDWVYCMTKLPSDLFSDPLKGETDPICLRKKLFTH